MKNLVFPAVIVIVIGFLLFSHYNSTPPLQEGIIVGVPDDSAGLLIDYLTHELIQNAENGDRKNSLIKPQQFFGVYSIRDCCTSIAEWALGGERLHMAIICPDAAARLLDADSRYETAGPYMVNSDVLVLRPGVKHGKIGITQNRWYQEEIVREKLGDECIIMPMLASALPFAYQKGELDGIVVDAGTAFTLPGEYHPGSTEDADRLTYVMVVRKGLQNTPEYHRFRELWRQAAEELTEKDTLQTAISSYQEQNETGKEARLWRDLGIRFLPPEQRTKR